MVSDRFLRHRLAVSFPGASEKFCTLLVGILSAVILIEIAVLAVLHPGQSSRLDAP
jgi:hypothetical protein